MGGLRSQAGLHVQIQSNPDVWRARPPDRWSDDKRVADIYFGEFMRVFAHHRFRESVKRHIKKFGSAAFNTWKPQDLFEDWRKWVPGQVKVGGEYEIKRNYFVG